MIRSNGYVFGKLNSRNWAVSRAEDTMHFTKVKVGLRLSQEWHIPHNKVYFIDIMT